MDIENVMLATAEGRPDEPDRFLVQIFHVFN